MAKYARYGLWIAVLATIIWTCGGTLFPERMDNGRVQLTIYGFSILREPLEEQIFPLFREKWRRETATDVEFVPSYAPSGTIANQIVNGTPADVAIFSHPGDADRVTAAHCALGDWRSGLHGGIVNRTAIAVLVRKGNPRRIARFSDLGQPGLQLIHPDPLTSGGAQWALLAEYGEPIMHALERGQAPPHRVAEAQLAAIWRNVVAAAHSARAARVQFNDGYGDAVVTYEVELLLDARRGADGEMVLPETTILTEHPVVLIDHHGGAHPPRPVASAFVEFLASDEAQRAFVRYGFRSVRPALDAENPSLAKIVNPYTVADLGGWDEARRTIVDRVWRASIVAGAGR